MSGRDIHLQVIADPYIGLMISDEPMRCPSCGKLMRLRQMLPSFGRQPELRTYECTPCGIVKTQKVAT